jgi:spore maturation protein CgeB
VSDWWPGLDSFFEPEREILVASTPEEMVEILTEREAAELECIGARARTRVMQRDTAMHRAAELEQLVAECSGARTP